MITSKSLQDLKTEGSPDLLNEFDTWLKIHPEIDEHPVDSLGLVLLLLEDEHMVIEKLLKFFVGKVDAKLLEGI